MTKVTCQPSSVRHNPGNTWTATCTVDYSDGSQWVGYGNFVPARNRVTFQPQRQIR